MAYIYQSGGELRIIKEEGMDKKNEYKGGKDELFFSETMKGHRV